jgi:hypothetical protein
VSGPGNIDLRLFVFPTCIVRVVIPICVRREFQARETLGFLPLIATSWTHAPGPERIPDCAATRYAAPATLGFRAPLAPGTKDLGLMHGV